MDEKLLEYRKDLNQTVQKLNENYDKLIITLSGGALGLSLVFVKDVVGSDQVQNPTLLLLSWVFFIFSLAAVLATLLFGIEANKKAVKQVDCEKIYEERAGGIFSALTNILHYSGVVFLFVGFFFIVSFVYSNLEVKNVQREKAKPTSAIETTKTVPESTNSEKRERR